MKVIGISGLENSVPFKQANWPGLEEREYRIAQGMDAAAALVIDGRLVAAAEEERFSGKKHTGDFPIDAIRFCLAEAGISIDEIDEIAHGFDYAPYRDLYLKDEVSAELYQQVFSREALLAQVRRDLPGFPEEKVSSVGHHLAHAASAAYTSGWDECLVVVNDAMGEIESLSVYDFHDGEFEKIRTVGANDSIGILYSLVTLHLGFDFNSDEYKIMGLAPYGDPARFRPFFEQTVELRDDGSIRIPILKLNRSREERENYLATRAYLDEHLVPRRLPVDPVTSIHQDVAAALQECLDRVVMHVCGHFAEQTGLRRIALAGGVALNCTANGKLMSSGLFDEVYVQPVAGDDGTALGAALYRTSLAGEVPNRRLPAPLFGPHYSTSDIEAALHRFGDKIQWQQFDSLEATCACSGQTYCRWTGHRLVSRPDGVWSARTGQSQHPRRSWAPRNARSHQRHGQEARSLPSFCARLLGGRSASLVRCGSGHGTSLHDQRGRCSSRGPGLTSCHNPRERFRSSADRICKRQSGFSCAASGRRRDHRPPDGAEHQL